MSDSTVSTEPMEPARTSCCGPAPSVSACGDSASCRPKTSGLTQWLPPLRSVWSLILLIPLIIWVLDSDQFGEMMSIATSALVSTLPFIAVAIFLIAYLKATGAESLVAKAFEGRTYRMIVLAALFGGLAPFCSCEVIPFVAALLAVGAPLSAVMAFWLSSPLIDPASLVITAGALGWHFAIAKAMAAVGLGLLGGFLVQIWHQHALFRAPLKAGRQTGGCCGTTPSGPSGSQLQWRFWESTERRQQFREQLLENGTFLLKWLMLAYLLEALLILYIPASLIAGVVGGEGVGAIALGALVGMPAYLNSFAAPPLVAGLVTQGMSLGAAMAFMLAGAISSLPAMTAVWSLVKWQIFVTYMALGFVGAVVLGFVYQLSV